MSKSHDVIASIDDETSADLDRLAAEWGCTRGHIATRALFRFLNEETRHWPTEFDHLPHYVETDPLPIALNEAERKAEEALNAFLEVGEQEIEAGRTISHDDFMREMTERCRSRSAA